jgi:hypothetical protein
MNTEPPVEVVPFVTVSITVKVVSDGTVATWTNATLCRALFVPVIQTVCPTKNPCVNVVVYVVADPAEAAEATVHPDCAIPKSFANFANQEST